MKLYHFLSTMLLCAGVAACTDLDTAPEGGVLTAGQKTSVTEVIPERVSADIAGMYAQLGLPGAALDDSRCDDCGYGGIALAQDMNGSDIVVFSNGFNWFETSSSLEDRTETYVISRIRWMFYYRNIKLCNDVIASIDPATESAVMRSYLGQAKALRAFDYIGLAPYYQFSYKTHKDSVCVPIVVDGMEISSSNPRATMEEVYEFIIEDLTSAIELLDGYCRPAKSYIDQRIAYGLRARAYLAMEKWAEAMADARKAMEGFAPYTRADVSKPAFVDINTEPCMWGIDISPASIGGSVYNHVTWVSVLSSFSADAYSTGADLYKRISLLLWNKINDTDVRKGWWVDENLHSDNLKNVAWGTATGDSVARLKILDVKFPFEPYTNVKFGMYEQIGGTVNAADWVLMRYEEMKFIELEAQAMGGDPAGAAAALQNFIREYRDPAFTCNETQASKVQDQIWLQRRIELWGEGFALADILRLNKNIVRFHEGEETNFPSKFAFNIKAGDPWLLLRIPQMERNSNKGIIQNTGGNRPIPGQNGDLKDGVTD